MRPGAMCRRAQQIGSVKRRGPALPGLRNRTGPSRVTLGRCEWPVTTTAIPAGERGALVDDVQMHPGDVEGHVRGQRVRPGAVIVVAAHGGHRRDAGERLEDGGAADVAGMNDVAHAAQGSKRLGPHEAVRVADHADQRAPAAAQAHPSA